MRQLVNEIKTQDFIQVVSWSSSPGELKRRILDPPTISPVIKSYNANNKESVLVYWHNF